MYAVPSTQASSGSPKVYNKHYGNAPAEAVYVGRGGGPDTSGHYLHHMKATVAA
jgi:hypothetical protein